MIKNNVNKGIFFAFVTAVISGVSIFYAKVAVLKIPALVLTTSRNSLVGLFFILIFILSGRLKVIKNIQKKQLFFLILIAIIGGSIPFYLFFSGLKMADPQIANYIHKSLFIWVALLSYLFLKEKFKLSYWLVFFGLVVGSLLIAPTKLHIGQGELMILTATVFWAVESILAKKVLQEVDSEVVGLFRMAGGGMILLISTFISGQTNTLGILNPEKITILFVGSSILFGYVYFWFKAIKLAPVSLVTMILTFSVVVGNILNFSLAGQQISGRDISYSLVILFSLTLFLLPNLKIQRLNAKSKS